MSNNTVFVGVPIVGTTLRELIHTSIKAEHNDQLIVAVEIVRI